MLLNLGVNFVKYEEKKYFFDIKKEKKKWVEKSNGNARNIRQ